MPVTVEWDNEDHTVIRTDTTGNWTWNEYHAAVDQARAMMHSVQHPVHLITLRHPGSVAPEGNALPHLRRVMRDLPPNQRLTIMVNPDSQSKMLMGVFRRVVPLFTRTFLSAGSLEEARRLIARYRQRYSIEG